MDENGLLVLLMIKQASSKALLIIGSVTSMVVVSCQWIDINRFKSFLCRDSDNDRRFNS